MNDNKRPFKERRGGPAAIWRFAVGLLLFLQASTGAASPATAPDSMKKVGAGRYIPLYVKPEKRSEATIRVESFFLDVLPVTNRDYREFVQANPSWRKTQVKKVFVDENYLRLWENDVEWPAEVADDAPVVYVSWFAARAYCQWKGKRLPKAAEWELAASASEKLPYAADRKEFSRRILEWYGRPSTGALRAVGKEAPNYWGIHDLHGLVWEWGSDFSTALVTGESRGDSTIDQGMFCGSGSLEAADPSNYAAFMRYAFRSSLKANYTIGNLGFRCAENQQ